MTTENRRRPITIALLGMALILCGGCSSTNKEDPLEKINRVIYNVNDDLDKAVLTPASNTYKALVPWPIRVGISNGFNNLSYFNVVFNDCLQGEWHQGRNDFGRFAINTTLGVGGILDIATPWGLPQNTNDFGITLGKWGVKPGPYLVAPLFGPDDLRDATSPVVETLCTALTWIDLPRKVTIPLAVGNAIQTRSSYDYVVRFRNAAAVDPYVFTREAYLEYRQGLIDQGKKTAQQQQNLYDEDVDTTEPSTQPSAQPSSKPSP
jgi:phospholipid-binding lipoprotein MlaA